MLPPEVHWMRSIEGRIHVTSGATSERIVYTVDHFGVIFPGWRYKIVKDFKFMLGKKGLYYMVISL